MLAYHTNKKFKPIIFQICVEHSLKRSELVKAVVALLHDHLTFEGFRILEAEYVLTH